MTLSFLLKLFLFAVFFNILNGVISGFPGKTKSRSRRGGGGGGGFVA